MAGETDGEVVVPPTLRALLAARLDQLDPAERGVLERGAVEGEIFHRGAVQALAPEEPGHAAPGRARPQGADPAGPAAAAGRGRLPLPPPPDPRRRLRRAAESDPGRAARALRRLARGARRRARRAGRDPRLPPRAGLPLPAELGQADRRAGRACAASVSPRPGAARSGAARTSRAAVNLLERAPRRTARMGPASALVLELGDALFEGPSSRGCALPRAAAEPAARGRHG